MPQGDPGGIGPEIALAVLARAETRRATRPLLLGHTSFLEGVARATGLAIALQRVPDAETGFAAPAAGPLPVLELECPLPSDPPGRPSAQFGRAAVEAFLRAGQLCLQRRAEAMVTPPLNKESMHLAGYAFEGQTQILGELCGSKRYGMLACNGRLRVLVATRHMALRQALDSLDVNAVVKQIRIAHEAARGVLRLVEPRIVLAGLNPHAGEGGAFGDEEARILAPAIAKAREQYGFVTAGPEVPDVVFKDGLEGRYDIVIALYHDQAFIPLKLLDRRQAYTLFVGGPVLRVSPMHGTAYELVRSGRADPEPFAFAYQIGAEFAARVAAEV